VPGCTASSPSSSRPTITFAPQLLLSTCRAISASSLILGSRFARIWPPPAPHEQSVVPLDLVRCFPFNGLRRPPRAILLPLGRVRSELSRCSISTSARASSRHHLPRPRSGAAHVPAVPAPVLARRQFICVAPHQLMPEPFARSALAFASTPPLLAPTPAPTRATSEPTRYFHCAAFQLPLLRRARQQPPPADRAVRRLR
jgi:hypothetical protein